MLAVLVLPPIGVLLQESLTKATPDGSTGALTLAHYAKLFNDPDLYVSAGNSVLFAAGATVMSLIFGGVLAWLVERTNAPLKTLAYLTTIISMGTPYILYVIAWLFLFGKVGPLNDFYRSSPARRHPVQRLLDGGHDPGRGLPVVAAGVPAASARRFAPPTPSWRRPRA